MLWVAPMQALKEKIQSLEQYTHVAFTSRNGIQAVLDALEALNSDGMAPEGLNSPGVRCCARGADAELLHQAGVSNVLTPKEVRGISAPSFLGAWCLKCPTTSAQPASFSVKCTLTELAAFSTFRLQQSLGFFRLVCMSQGTYCRYFKSAESTKKLHACRRAHKGW